MTVVHMSAYRRRGGLRPGQVWLERAFPERQWVIAQILVGEEGQRRLVIEPLHDPAAEASYSETYFRRHFIDRHQWLRQQNQRLLRQARKKDSAELLHEMAQMNAH